MAYISNADVTSRIGNQKAAELTTDTGSTPDTALIDRAIRDVEGKINSVVRKRTAETITLAAFPESFAALAGCTMSLVLWQLHFRRPPIPEDWTKARDAANAWLTKLAAGEVDLADPGSVSDDFAWGSNPQNLTGLRDQ